VTGLSGWAAGERDSDRWTLRFDRFVPGLEARREALCTLGNGYWATRGAAPETSADPVHYPGTYFAGVYNRVRAELGEFSLENEYLVNAPNWLCLRYRIDAGEWLCPEGPALLEYHQALDLRRGVLTRVLRLDVGQGRSIRVTSRRIVSQTDPHIAVLQTRIEAEGFSGTLTVQSAIDGRVSNANVPADRLLVDGQPLAAHLVPRHLFEVDGETILLEMETSQTGVHMAMAARTRVSVDGSLISPHRTLSMEATGWIAHEFSMRLSDGHPVEVEKALAVCTSRDRAIASTNSAVVRWLDRLEGAEVLQRQHESAWRTLWDAFAVSIQTNERQALALNLNTFHVLQAVGGSDPDLDAGTTARGLHGEGYQGHIFWDELFVYPMITLRRPDLSVARLGYRYRRLGEARFAARETGFEGAMYPWQSGIDGRDATPERLYNPRSGLWIPDNSRLQRHVGIAVVYSVWQYFQATGDEEYLIKEGAEIILEVARFFASMTQYDELTDRYDIEGVMGPDEFHDGYPDAPGIGLRNNAYTNVLTAWLLRRAIETVALLSRHYCQPLWDRLRLQEGEVERWERISRRIRVPFHADGVMSQFEGYERLPEFNWAGYRKRYGSLKRLDLILNAEGDSTNNYRVSKQADVLMLLYLFSAEELRALLEDLGYELTPEAVVRTVEFYGSRSTHGSTLSNVVHSWVESRRDRSRSWEFLERALDSDLADDPDSTTGEGIHLGAMAGSLDLVVRCYTGLEIRHGRLWLHPVLPPEISAVSFAIIYREQPIRLELDSQKLILSMDDSGAGTITVVVDGREAVLSPGERRVFALSPALS
jgi:trehalose/maltose hydrolase-like predicted phosphorylase